VGNYACANVRAGEDCLTSLAFDFHAVVETRTTALLGINVIRLGSDALGRKKFNVIMAKLRRCGLG
jgi:hypothetical protein